MKRPLPIILQASIMAGTSIQDAAIALCCKAALLNSYVSADFNGNVYTAGPDTVPQDIIDEWDRRQRASADDAPREYGGALEPELAAIVVSELEFYSSDARVLSAAGRRIAARVREVVKGWPK